MRMPKLVTRYGFLCRCMVAMGCFGSVFSGVLKPVVSVVVFAGASLSFYKIKCPKYGGSSKYIDLAIPDEEVTM